MPVENQLPVVQAVRRLGPVYLPMLPAVEQPALPAVDPQPLTGLILRGAMLFVPQSAGVQTEPELTYFHVIWTAYSRCSGCGPESYREALGLQSHSYSERKCRFQDASIIKTGADVATPIVAPERTSALQPVKFTMPKFPNAASRGSNSTIH
jgi:hypothetical protein